MVTIKLSLDKRKVKRDSTYPICFRIYHEGSSTTKSSKIHVKEEHWNENKKCIRKSHPNAATLNKLLVEKMNELQNAISAGKNDLVPDVLKPTPFPKPVSPIKVWDCNNKTDI